MTPTDPTRDHSSPELGDATRTHPPAEPGGSSDAALDAGLAAAFVPALTGSHHPTPEPEPDTILAGKYRLSERIGEGGMGSVWVAHQTEPVKRKVAIKLIKPGMDSRQVLARFEAERQALAVMDHPNIAKVLDGGLHDGRPFFVMELVKGIPITEFCDERKLTPRERLELFVPVCQAIQHAHQKGVIHRDIKPSNVLIALYDDKPVPKVIDFGVAKATGGTLTEHTIETAFNSVVGTPQYMSPEQASLNNLDIDTRSDVYSLGVLLYELLTGSPPFSRKELKEKGILEILRVVREEEPPRPSAKLSSADALPTLSANRSTEPRKLTKLLRSELDWLVMKALEKDRARRYETANGFAADVQRYLAGEAVVAHPPSTGYRLRKFVRRNRLQVIAGALILLVLLAGIAGTTIGLVWADQRRIEAEAARTNEALERRRAESAEVETLGAYEASTDETIEHLIGSKPELGPQEKRYLTITLERWQAFASRKGDDPHSLTIRAEGHSRVAYLWDKLNDKEKARTEYQTAKTIWMILVGQFPTEPKYRLKLAQTLHKLVLTIGSVGKEDEALVETRAARDLIEKLVSDFPDVSEYRQTMAENHRRMGTRYMATKKYDEALKEYELAIELLQKLVAKSPGMTSYEKELATSYNASLVPLLALKRYELARTAGEAQLRLRKKLADQFPESPEYKSSLANAHLNLVAVLGKLGKYPEARAELKASIEIQEQIVKLFPGIHNYVTTLGMSYYNYGATLGNEGKRVDSLEWLDRAIRTIQPVFEREPRSAGTRPLLRECHLSRARTYAFLQKPAEAVKDWDRALLISTPTEQQEVRASRVYSLTHVGRIAEAVADIAELEKASNWNAEQWYVFASVYSVAGGKIADKKAEYGDRAMELLRQAVKAGWKDAAHMKQDTDLDPLRDRADFQKLLADLEVKYPPPPEVAPMPREKK